MEIMKICPNCSQTYGDETLNYCLMDGAVLNTMTASSDDPARTAILHPPDLTMPSQRNTEQIVSRSPLSPPQKRSYAWIWLLVVFGAAVVLIGGGVVALLAVSYKYAGSKKVDSSRSSPLQTPFPTFSPVPVPSLNTVPGPPTPSKTGSSYLTMENFNKLYVGMPKSEVERILGGTGVEVAPSSGTAGMRFSVLKWEGDNYKSIILSFENDKIMTKSQVGLK